MTPQRAQERVVADMIRGHPGTWDFIELELSAVTGTMSGRARTNTGEWLKLSRQSLAAIRRLRESMANPTNGAWLSVVAKIPRTGEPEFDYDYTSQPNWFVGADMAPALYIDDLRNFPRAPGYIPDWYPRQGTPPPSITPAAATPPAHRPAPPAAAGPPG